MKHHIEWLKEQINIHVEMTVSELLIITICLAALAGIFITSIIRFF